MGRCFARAALIAGISLVELHSPNGQRIEINPSQVSSVRQPVDIGGHQWGKGTHCILVMGNGGFIAVTERCEDVRSKLQAN
jgi:hypothetical protein